MNSNAPSDRRVTRTKLAIREALVALITEKGFGSISVRDITTRADINRATFYLHYHDKFDLLVQTEDEIIKDIEDIILQAKSLNLADFNSTDRPLPILVTMFEYLRDHAPLMHAILGIEGDFAFMTRLSLTVERNLKLGFLAGIKASNFLVPSDYLISYAVSAHYGVIQTWLKKGCMESPKDMAVILSKLSWDGPIRTTGFVLKSGA